MARDNRVKRYAFKTDDLVCPATGSNFDIFTAHSLNGTLQAIQYLGANYGATGSLQLQVSGTGEVVWSLVSGTDAGNVTSAAAWFPRASCRDTNNLSLSGLAYAELPLFGDYRLIGSCVGPSKSGLGFVIWYI